LANANKIEQRGRAVLDAFGASSDLLAMVMVRGGTRSQPPRHLQKRFKRVRKNPDEKLTESCIDLLAHLRALQWLAWQAHWVAFGPNFYGDHLLLERLYTGKKGGPNIQMQIDGLGERMVAYFGPQSVNPVESERRVLAILNRLVSAEPLMALSRLEETTQAVIRSAWKSNKESGNPYLGLDNFFMQLADERDVARYLLRQRVSR
jgi:DNA-binding ferritin-like protein